MAASVTMFNTTAAPVEIRVNNGQGFTIPGAAAPSYAPGVAASNPTFTGGYPAPGSIGFGTNMIALTPSGRGSVTAMVELSQNQQWFSVQIYVFCAADGTCAWTLLNNGQLARQGTAQ